MSRLLCSVVLLVVVVRPAPSAAADAPTAPSRQSHEEWMAELGYVRHSGGWRTAQEIVIIERNDRANLAQKQWQRKIERLRQQVVAAGGASGRGAEELREITDPDAIPALTAALAGDASRQIRLLSMESLVRIGTPAAQMALVSAALDHPDPETRIDATERLATLGPQTAATAASAALAGADNARINRAAMVLARLGVKTVVPQLIAVLETRQVVTVGDGPADGSTTATFTPEGGGLTLGSSRRQVVMLAKNEQVLAALVTLTGQNFGWDLAAWRAWLARQRAPATLDLRRG